jgi:hypothetical protein
MALGCRANRETTRVPESTIVDASTAMAAPTVIELALETGWGCALRSDGSVHCWGQGDPGQIVGLRSPRSRWEIAGVLEGLQAVDIATSRDRLCAVQRDGTVRCLDVRDRVLPGDEFQGVAEVEVGDFVCTRSHEGAVHCVDPDHSDAGAVMEGIVDLAVEGSQGCGLDGFGTVSCWAMEQIEYRKLDGESEWLLSLMRPTEITRFPGIDAFASFDLEWDKPRFCFLHAGTIACASEPDFVAQPELEAIMAFAGTATSNCAIHATGELTCAGDNRWGRVGDGSSITKAGRFEVEGVANPTIVAMSASYACAASGEEVRCWGTRLTNPDDAFVEEQHHFALDATGIAIDGYRTCASTESNGLLCWGPSEQPELAEEGILGVAAPRPVELDLGPLRKIQGGCLLDQSGNLACSQLGDLGSRSGHITDFVLGRVGSCWIRDHALACFDRFGGQLARAIPQLNRPTALAGGADAICSIHAGGKVGCFSLLPVDGGVRGGPLVVVDALSDVVAIAWLASSEFVALDGGGTVWTWKFRREETPPIRSLAVYATGVDEIATSDNSLCIRLGDQVRCEQTGSREQEFADVAQLAAGIDFFCVRHGDGSLTCGGNNRLGQLGVAPATVMLEPTTIEFEP